MCKNENKNKSLMADAAKHPSINDRRPVAQLKTLYSLPKTKRSSVLYYGFMFAFVAFVLFLALTPSSNSSSLWFASIFTSFSTGNSSIALSNFSSSVLKKPSNGTNAGLVEKLANCDLFDGEWVSDDSYPLYKPGSCSLIDEKFNCFANGRPDDAYCKLKWKPKGCNLPRYEASVCVSSILLLQVQKSYATFFFLRTGISLQKLCDYCGGILRMQIEWKSHVGIVNGKKVSFRWRFSQ